MTRPGQGIESETDGLLGLATVCRGFFQADDACRSAHVVTSRDVPAPFDSLLVHENHMTSTLVGHYGQPVRLDVLKVEETDDWYSRLILLTLAETGQVVELGVARIRLDTLGGDVRDMVVSQRQPLGDILIEHDVLRTIHPQWYFRFGADHPFLAHFDSNGKTGGYGRIGVIRVSGKPVIDVLEVVADVSVEGR